MSFRYNYSNPLDHADYYQALVKEYVDKGEDIVRLWFGPNLAVFPLNSDATKVRITFYFRMYTVTLVT